MTLRVLTRFVLTVALAFPLARPAWADRDADRLYEEAVRQHGTVSVNEQFDLYARAAEQGHVVAQYNVAMMYANGEGVNVDYQQAVYWFRKSAGQLFAPAQFRLGELRYFGMGGLDADPQAAARLFKAAAAQGDPDGCMNLAMMTGSGEAVPADTGSALDLLECAADGAHELASEYTEWLKASPDGRFSEAQRTEYWDRQRQYWVDMAAQFGVREAEEAVSGGSPVP